MKYYFLMFIVINITFFSCNKIHYNKNTENTSSNEVMPKELFYNYFSIVLPEIYEIELYRGPDFRVFHIDTDDKAIGGIYLGNYPSSVIKNGKYVKDFKSIILKELADWKIYNTENYYISEIIISGKMNWASKIHFWFLGRTIEEIEQNILLFSKIEWNEKL